MNLKLTLEHLWTSSRSDTCPHLVSRLEDIKQKAAKRKRWRFCARWDTWGGGAQYSTCCFVGTVYISFIEQIVDGAVWFVVVVVVEISSLSSHSKAPDISYQ